MTPHTDAPEGPSLLEWAQQVVDAIFAPEG